MAKGELEVAHIFDWVKRERGAKKKQKLGVLVKGGEGYRWKLKLVGKGSSLIQGGNPGFLGICC